MSEGKITIIQHLSKDPILQPLLQTLELPNTSPSGKVYEGLLSAIVYQQLSTKAADVIYGRFLQLFGGNTPTPNQLLACSADTLRTVGISAQKAGYLHNIARFFEESGMDNAYWQGLSDEELLTRLTAIKGVGNWTVQMILMFDLGRLDVLPVGDFGIRQSMAELYQLSLEQGKAAEAKMIAIAETWRPYRSVACRYLWQWKNSK